MEPSSKRVKMDDDSAFEHTAPNYMALLQQYQYLPEAQINEHENNQVVAEDQISFADVPDELIHVIFRYLSPVVHLPRISVACSKFYKMIWEPNPQQATQKPYFSHLDFAERPAIDSGIVTKLSTLSGANLLSLNIRDCFRTTTQEIEGILLTCPNLRHLAISTSDQALGAGLPASFQHVKMASLMIYRQLWGNMGGNLIPMRLLAVFPNLRLLDTDGFNGTNWDRVAQLCPCIDRIGTGTVSVDTDRLRSALSVWKPVVLKMPWFSYEYEKIGDLLTHLPLESILLPRYQITGPDFLDQIRSLKTIKIIYNSWLVTRLTLTLTLPLLEHLDVSGCADQVDFLIKCPKLRYVNFNRCSFHSVSVESPDLEVADLSCSEWTANDFENFLTLSGANLRSIDLRGLQFFDPDQQHQIDPNHNNNQNNSDDLIPVRNLLDGRSSKQVDLIRTRLMQCNINAALLTARLCGHTLTDLYIPLESLDLQHFKTVLFCCKLVDRVFANDYVDIPVSSLLASENCVADLLCARYPPEATLVTQDFEGHQSEVLRGNEHGRFLHLYCSWASRFANLLGCHRTRPEDVELLELSSMNVSSTVVSNIIRWFQNLKTLKFDSCTGSYFVQLIGSHLETVSIRQQSLASLDIILAPNLIELEISRCKLVHTDGSDFVIHVHPLVPSRLKSVSLRRLDRPMNESSNTWCLGFINNLLSKLPDLEYLRLDQTSFPASKSTPSSNLVGLAKSTNLKQLILPASVLLVENGLQTFLSDRPEPLETLELDCHAISGVTSLEVVHHAERLLLELRQGHLKVLNLVITGLSDLDPKTELQLSSIQRRSNEMIRFVVDGIEIELFNLEAETRRSSVDMRAPIAVFMADRFEQVCLVD